jgi:hypothetical protein
MTEVDITRVPLSFAEEAELAQLEDQVENGLRTFMQVGLALVTINENKLYRATHSTFVAYAEDRFGLTGSYAYRVMAGAKVVTELPSPIGDIITVESQARELVGLPTKQAAEVLIEAIDTTGGKPTAEAIRDARLRIVKPAETVVIQRQAPKRHPLPKDIRAAHKEVLAVGRKWERVFRDDRWSHHRDQLVVYQVDELRKVRDLLSEVLVDLDGQA